MRFGCLTSYLDHWANHAPDRVFLCASAQRWTYSEGAAEVDRRSRMITQQSEGQPVAITGNNSSDWVLNVLAVLKGGLPIVLLPATMPDAEAKRFNALSGALLQMAGSNCKRLVRSPEHHQADVFRSCGASLAFPTSGSTGAVRLALRSAESLVDEGERYLRFWALTPEDTIMAVLPLCHAYVLGAALAGALVSGSALWTSHFVSHRSLAAEICSSKTTILPLVRPIAQALALGDDGTPVSSRLRIAMVGASPIAANTANSFHARWAVWLSQNYGSAETGATLASFYPESVVSTGSPMQTVECALVPDNEAGGQLWVKLQAPPLGYLTEEGRDCTKLSPDRWWPTGDLFTKDAKGSFVFSQRISGGIRRGGRSIQPCEVEDALREHPAVKEVCVIGEKESEGQERVEAYVQVQAGAAPSISELREHLRSRISEFKIPTQWIFSDELPRTWSGKVDPQSLRHWPRHTPVTDGTRQLMAYRVSEALLTAENLGLIDRLGKSEATVEVLAEELGLDRVALKIFLTFLEMEGLARQNQERWSITFKPPQDWKQICSLECELRRSWLSAAALEQVVRAGLRDRDFDRGAASEEFASAYANAVCGPALALSIRHLLRVLRLPATARVLEIGRGVGCLYEALSSHTGARRIIPLGPPPAILYPGFRKSHGKEGLPAMRWEQVQLRPGEFDLIVLINCIHWIRPEEFGEIFETLSTGLAPEGTLAVLDSFFCYGTDQESAGDISSVFLLDWITHGGCSWLTTEELAARLGNAGFEKTVVRSFANLQQRWVLAHPGQHRSPSGDPALEGLQHQGA
jgi:acyl-CoA synthetase (AMP-forming)/AMP-acid ligase II